MDTINVHEFKKHVLAGRESRGLTGIKFFEYAVEVNRAKPREEFLNALETIIIQQGWLDDVCDPYDESWVAWDIAVSTYNELVKGK